MSWLPLLWFLAVLALIPLALWLLKRSPLTPMAQGLRVVAATHLGPGQRLLTVEVGEGEARRWLLLGATAHHINLLTELPPQALPQAAPPSFAKLLRRQGTP
jgi:flagellar protein FliO/FliZ